MSTAACPTCGGSLDAETGVCPQCTTQVNLRSGGTRTETATVVTPHEHTATETPEISGYRVINSLGEGGMGAVYLAEETTLGRRVAVKVISSRVAPDAQSKARFLREARTLATIEHPHVVRVYSFGEVEGRPYLAMEYVEGETLMDRIARLGKLSIDDALRITRDIVDALDAAWDKRVIHRDIKPSNILIDRRNRVRVADFGLAKPMDIDESQSALTLSGLMVGTPHYISPEQAQGKELDFRSDFYSLGIMLFHMLTGERPFQGTTPVAIVAKHIHEPMPLVTSRRADIPSAIERLIQWMTQKDAEKRPGSHQELLAAIDGLITRTPTAPMPTFTSMPIEAPRKPARRRTVMALAVLVIAAIAAASVFIWRKKEEPFQLAAPEFAFIVAVAPFYGPDDDSAKEGRVMAALIERAVANRLGKGGARVLGIEETKTAVRSHDEARELGTKLHASAVIWGEAFALRTETEIRPYVTLVAQPKLEAPARIGPDARLLADTRLEATENLADTGGAAVKLEAEAPNQIELRKTSASGIGDLVVLLAGIHALENEKNYRKALDLFRQAPRTAETLRYEVQALLPSNRREEARQTLEQAIALDPNDAPSHALLGDLHLAENRMAEGIAAYQRAAALGQPYVTTRGILHEGKLYLRETYKHEFQSSGEETDTMFLLEVDPATQTVHARHSLPGTITSMRTDGDALVIAYNGGTDNEPVPAELRLRNGAFDRPYWPPPSLLWRVRSHRGGRVLSGNFLGEIDNIRTYGQPGGRFVLRPEPAADLPATLPDLERALRAAAQRDPTQPSHLFFLAMTLRAQNRMAEANAVLDELIRRDYPGVPYFHYTWMLGTLERVGYGEWTDRLYPKALAARRKLPQQQTFSTLIERLINAQFIRQAASNRNVARGYGLLLKARELVGITPEGEDLVAAAWAKYFDAKGDRARAAHEREVVRVTHAHPFNFLGAIAKVDYALTAAAATLIGFVLLSVFVAVNAIRRAKLPGPQPRTVTTALRDRMAKLAGPMRAAVLGLVLSGGMIGAAALMIAGALGMALIVIAALVVIALAWRWLRVSPVAALGSISRRERIAVLVSYLVFIASVIALIDRSATYNVIAGIPIGFNDSIGHVRIVQDLENRLKTVPAPALSYVAALANHYAGNTDRAAQLYGAADDYGATRQNRAALAAGRMPAVPATAEQVFAALGGSRLHRWREVVIGKRAVAIPFLLAPLLALLLFAVRPRVADGEPVQASWPAKIAMIVLPGVFDVRTGAVWRAWITIVLIATPVLAAVAEITPAFLVTRASMPHFPGAFPLPTNAADPMAELEWTFRLAFPYAKVYWSLVVAAGIIGLALHAMRIPAILRTPRPIADEDQPTRVNIASVST